KTTRAPVGGRRPALKQPTGLKAIDNACSSRGILPNGGCQGALIHIGRTQHGLERRKLYRRYSVCFGLLQEYRHGYLLQPSNVITRKPIEFNEGRFIIHSN